jgi:hypothetical protein
MWSEMRAFGLTAATAAFVTINRPRQAATTAHNRYRIVALLVEDGPRGYLRIISGRAARIKKKPALELVRIAWRRQG